MTTEINQDAGAQADKGAGEGKKEEVETVAVPKADYDKLNQTLGSLKRELKDLKAPKEEAVETPSKTKSDNQLLEKAFLRSAGIASEKEVDLALSTAKKWGISVDALVDDEDFKIKLDKLRTQTANELATSGVKGSAGKSQAKETPEYWIAKGTPPTAADVPDRETRVKIAKAMVKNAKTGKQFYNS